MKTGMIDPRSELWHLHLGLCDLLLGSVCIPPSLEGLLYSTLYSFFTEQVREALGDGTAPSLVMMIPTQPFTLELIFY